MELPKRKNIRKKGYDYSQNGCYFITICTYKRECIFGDVVDGVMQLNEYGEIVKRELLLTEEKRPYGMFDNYAIMPNHVHILITLFHDREQTLEEAYMLSLTDTARRVPTGGQFGEPTEESIPTIIRSFKSASTNVIRRFVGTRRAVSDEPHTTPDLHTISNGFTEIYAVWQGRYHDNIIRSERSYQNIFQYISNNPAQWESDCHNPANPKYNKWEDRP